MKDFLDRLNDMFDDVYDSIRGEKRASDDPDFARAWSDLDKELKAGRYGGPGGPKSAFDDIDRDFAEFDAKFGAQGKFHEDFERLKAEARNRQHETGSAYGTRSDNSSGQSGHDSANRANFQSGTQGDHEDPLRKMATQLVRDYGNLELKQGANVEEVRAAYKRMIKQYHPDRFASDPEKQKTATAITAKLNESYGRLMEYLGAR